MQPKTLLNVSCVGVTFLVWIICFVIIGRLDFLYYQKHKKSLIKGYFYFSTVTGISFLVLYLLWYFASHVLGVDFSSLQSIEN